MSRRPMPRRRTIAIGSLALVLVGAPFLPDGDTPPALETASTPGVVARRRDTAARAPSRPPCAEEIDAVPRRGSRRRARPPAPASGRRPCSRSQVRCADFEGQRYCLNAGWTDSTQRNEVVTELAQERYLGERAIVVPRGDRRPVADRPAPPARRAEPRPPREGRPCRAHRRRPAVAKVWLLRHQVQGVALPEGFLARHPEVRPGPRHAPPPRPPPPPDTTARKSSNGLPVPAPTVLRKRRGGRADPVRPVRSDVDADDRVGLERHPPAARLGRRSSAPPRTAP